MNEGIVLDNSIRLGSSMGHLNRDTVWLADIISIVNMLGSIYAVWLSIELLLGTTPRSKLFLNPLFPARKITGAPGTPLKWKPDRKLYWNRKDTIILFTITIIFSAVSLLTLGSTKAPQSEWTASSDEEQIIFDLGEHQGDLRLFVLFFFFDPGSFLFSESLE